MPISRIVCFVFISGERERDVKMSYREIERRERSRDKRVVRFEREESAITALIVLFRRIGRKIQQTKENLIILFFVAHPFF